MNKFKKVMLGALSVLTLGLFVATGTKVTAASTNNDDGSTTYTVTSYDFYGTAAVAPYATTTSSYKKEIATGDLTQEIVTISSKGGHYYEVLNGASSLTNASSLTITETTYGLRMGAGTYFTFDLAKLQLVKSQYQKYSSSKQINVLNHFFDYDENYLTSQKTNDFKTIKFKIADSVCQDIRDYLVSSGISPAEILYYCNELSHQYKKFNWAFAWDILDTQILAFIPQGVTKAPVNIKDVNSEDFELDPQFINSETGEYLGQTYVLKDVSKSYWQAKKDEIEREKQLAQIQQQVEALEEKQPQTEEEQEATEKEIEELVDQFIETATSTVSPRIREESTPKEEPQEEESKQKSEQEDSQSEQEDSQPESQEKEKVVYTGDDEWKNYTDDTSFGNRFAEWWDLYKDVDDDNSIKKEETKRSNTPKRK